MSADFTALIGTTFAIAVGLGLVAICLRLLKVDSGALLVAVLFAPALLYLGLSGRLLEFKGLGMEAKFQQAAARSVTPTSVRPVAPSASEIRDQSPARAFMGIGSEVVLLEAPKTDMPVTRQRVLDIALKIYPGLLQGKFELLVVVDEADRVLGYFNRYYFLDLLRIEVEQAIRGSRTSYDANRVGEQLEQTQLWDLVQYPSIRADAQGIKFFISPSDSNATALSKLASVSQDAAVVVDSKGMYAGIVRRQDIVAELLGALAGHPSPVVK